MKLFHIQDSDRPMYVVAKNWHSALANWQFLVQQENELDSDDLPDPDGVSLIADDQDILLHDLLAISYGSNPHVDSESEGRDG